MVIALLPLLVLGCQGQCAKPVRPPDNAEPAPAGNAQGQLTDEFRSSPFLARCAPGRGGLITTLVNEAIGTTRGEVVWGTREFGSGGHSRAPAQRQTQRDYGGMFIFQRDGAEQPVTANDADAIMKALRAAFERELTASGVRITDTQVAKDGETLTGFTLTYEDRGTGTNGSINATIRLPRGTGGPDRLASLSVQHRETSTRE